MATQLTASDARESLSSHVAAKGSEIREKYGPSIGWKEIHLILEDRACVRYPCEIVFDGGPLYPGEFAHPIAKGDHPEDGFLMHIHPFFMTQPDRLAYLICYQLVLVNYGGFASPDDAETFGAAVLGMEKDEYYQILCQIADQIGDRAAV